MNYKNKVIENLNNILEISSKLKENEYIKVANYLKDINQIFDKIQNNNLINGVEENNRNNSFMIYHNGSLRTINYNIRELNNITNYIPELNIYIYKYQFLKNLNIFYEINRENQVTLEELYNINRRLLKTFNLMYDSRHTKKKIKRYLKYCNIRIIYFDSKRKSEIIAEILNILENY